MGSHDPARPAPPGRLAAGVRVTVYEVPAAPGDVAVRARRVRRYRLVGLGCVAVFVVAGIIRLVVVVDPSSAHRMWFEVVVGAVVGLVVVGIGVVVASLVRQARTGPAAVPPAPAGGLWDSQLGIYNGPFGAGRGWRGCDRFRPEGGDAPGDGERGGVAAYLRVDQHGLQIVGDSGQPRAGCSWAMLARIDVHHHMPPGSDDWVGLTTIDDRYAVFQSRRAMSLSVALHEWGASMEYRTDTTIRTL